MISTSWLAKRRSYWGRIEELLARSDRAGISALTHRELQELALLYRQAASDLATVREDPTGRQLAHYLNQLLGRTHNLIYMGRRARPRGILHFYRDTFPQVFHETLPYTVTATVVFLAVAAAGLLTSLLDPGFERYLLGRSMIETIERHEMWTHSIVTIKPLASSGIMTNNLSVAFAMFAMGITAGLGTVWMLMLNGLLFGVVNAACWQNGMTLSLWSFLAPHGVLELPAIFLAGGAGLLIARGLLFPGLLPRRDSLVAAGGQAVRLLLGAIPMLVLAGVVEGFVSPTDMRVSSKLSLAAALGVLLALYLMRKSKGQSSKLKAQEVKSGVVPLGETRG